MPDDAVTRADHSSDDVKYLFVTGGVMSGLGKGITAASVGRLLENRGLDVTAIKVDPYINVDAGTMNPFQHGEVYVLSDGGEVDLDLGTYERFLGKDMESRNNITTGKVYRDVINSERNGEYLGETVQIIPHVTDSIKQQIRTVADGHDVCIIEVGGTVGDIESMPFLEVLRQFHVEESEDDLAYMHVTLIPHAPTGEQKTKPTQHSVKELRSTGIEPDIIVGRCTEPLTQKTREKIAMFCDVPTEAVFSNPDNDDLYEIPLMLADEGLDSYLVEKYDLDTQGNGSAEWEQLVNAPTTDKATIGIVGKYDLDDAYHSIYESLDHVGLHEEAVITPQLINSETLTDESDLSDVDGIIVPGGFGQRGIDGKLLATRYAYDNDVPFLGLCLGFQMAVVMFARQECGLAGAHSTEVDDQTPHPVIDLLPEQKDIDKKGATMRLGSYETELQSGTLARSLYDAETVSERHRHRYEVNPEYIDILERNGLVFSGTNAPRMEILELPTDGHPYFVGTQFHPEYTSRPLHPNPLFTGFVRTALGRTPTEFEY